MSLPATQLERKRTQSTGWLTVAYFGMVLFFIVYYVRPADWIPGLETFPFAKLAAAVALFGASFAFLFRPNALLGPMLQSAEMKGLLALFAWMLAVTPFAIWRGGSLRMLLGTFAGVLLITVLIGVTANSVSRMRSLLAVSVLTMTVWSGFAIYSYRTGGDIVQAKLARIEGEVSGAFGNPNDLALNIVLVLPFCLVFALNSRGIARKLLWTICAGLMCLGVLVTFSRGGFIALAVAGIICIVDIGLNGKKFPLVIAALVLAATIAVAITPSGYGARLATIFKPSSDPTGSSQERLELLHRSLEVTVQRPLWGIGPGNFPLISGLWRGTHNMYTQLTAEAGIPALLIFLWIMWKSFRKLNRTVREARDPQVKLLARAARASLLAMLLSGLFYHNAYQFFTYFLVGYTVALYRMAEAVREKSLAPVAEVAGTKFVGAPSKPGFGLGGEVRGRVRSRFEAYAHLYFKES